MFYARLWPSSRAVYAAVPFIFRFPFSCSHIIHIVNPFPNPIYTNELPSKRRYIFLAQLRCHSPDRIHACRSPSFAALFFALLCARSRLCFIYALAVKAAPKRKKKLRDTTDFPLVGREKSSLALGAHPIYAYASTAASCRSGKKHAPYLRYADFHKS